MRDDGVLYICNLEQVSSNGNMPMFQLARLKKYWFEIRTVGVNRTYQAKGVNERIDFLLRIPRDTSITIGQYAILGNGEQYRIDVVSHGQDISERSRIYNSYYYKQPTIAGLEYTELTLSKVENYYAVATD